MVKKKEKIDEKVDKKIEDKIESEEMEKRKDIEEGDKEIDRKMKESERMRIERWERESMERKICKNDEVDNKKYDREMNKVGMK
jgi:hypothetical protein